MKNYKEYSISDNLIVRIIKKPISVVEETDVELVALSKGWSIKFIDESQDLNENTTYVIKAGTFYRLEGSGDLILLVTINK